MDFLPFGLPTPVALALIALLGYAIGRSAKAKQEKDVYRARCELKRAKTVARELETIAEAVRRNLATHHSSIARFKDRVGQLSSHQKESAWQELCKEAEEMLKPTLRLAAQMAHAYDEIRQQSNQLMMFTEVRMDPLTRVSNRRALDETLETMFALLNRYGQPFSIVIFDIDHFKQVNDEKGHLFGDRTLKSVARLISQSVRETDMVARYGGEEFVVVMPHTDLEGACVFSDRVCSNVGKSMTLTISGGVAQAYDGDNEQTLLSRADTALYGAKAGGRNRVYRHTGLDIEPVATQASPTPVSPVISSGEFPAVGGAANGNLLSGNCLNANAQDN